MLHADSGPAGEQSKPPSMSPSIDLLFQVVREAGDPTDSGSRTRELAGQVEDWQEMLALTRYHSLSSQLHTALKESGDVVPQSIMESLQKRNRTLGLRNLRHSQQMHELAACFIENGIRALPYKGPVVTQVAHDDIAGRSFGDLDFLVAQDDLVRARKLLRAEGYEQMNYTDVAVDLLVDDPVFRWGRELRFRSEEADLPVELRFQFIGGDRPGAAIFADLWRRRTDVEIAGRSVPALSPPDRALLLLVHGTKHGWRRLSWVYDIALLLRQDVDWETVLRRAEQYGWRDAVLLGLSVTSELTGLSVPSPMRSGLASRPICTWGSSLVVELLRRDPYGESIRLEPFTTVLFLNDSTWGSLAEAIDVLCAPRKADYEFLSLPPRLHPLYYAVRPIRLGKNVVKR